MCSEKNEIKFSILIPTKDRFDLLQYAVKSVLMQSYNNWELVISDNCSKFDIETWIKNINDKRIKYVKQIMPLSVTENWNAANEYAHGDYKIMLGDDDALLPNALQILAKKIAHYNYPDLLVFCAFIYLQPNVDPICTGGDLWESHPLAEYLEEQFLDIEERQKIVSDCCQFKRNFGYNMQHYCYSRKIESSVKKYGNFYESPYPDYYTASIMIYIAERVLYIKDEITVIGVTPKSYGYYYRNNIEKEGMKFHKEANYREYAPLSIKNKLCSIDEMTTAAAATFALLAHRIEALNVNIINYYRIVIENQIKYIEKEQLQEVIKREMLPNINKKEKTDLMQFFEYCCNENMVQKSKDRILGTKQIPYLNILQIIKNFEEIKEEIKSDIKIFDINYWLRNIKWDIVRLKVEGKKIYIWGAYARGKFIRQGLNKHQIIVDAYIDSDMQKKEFDSCKVFNPKEILRQKDVVIILAHLNMYQSVINALKENSFMSTDGYLYTR